MTARFADLPKAFVGQKYEVKFTDKSLGAVAFLHVTEAGAVYMIGFSGKRAKPDGNVQDWVALAYADTPPALWPVAERSLLAHVERIQKLCLGR